MSIKLIVAMGKNNEIGKDNKLLWHLPSDMAFFKETTLGHSVIMGRKTFESLPKPLDFRQNVVITQNQDFKCDNPRVVVVHSITAAMLAANSRIMFVIGGSSIYKQFMDYADAIYCTKVNESFPDADAFFPKIDQDLWEPYKLEFGYDNGFEYERIMYLRKPGGPV